MSENRTLLIRLLAEIENELQSISRLEDDLRHCRKGKDNRIAMRAKASILHDFYTGAEHIFTKVASELNGGIPNTPQWHSDLLRDMCLNLEEIRPPVITVKLRDALMPFLRFRHLFRNMYGFDLDPARMDELVDAFPDVLEQLKSEIGIFIGWLRKTSGLAPAGG